VKIREQIALLESSLNQVLDSLMESKMLELKVDVTMLSQHNELNNRSSSPFGDTTTKSAK